MQDGQNNKNMHTRTRTPTHKHPLVQSNYKFIQRSSNFIN
jgi:hypothetical protein